MLRKMQGDGTHARLPTMWLRILPRPKEGFCPYAGESCDLGAAAERDGPIVLG